MTSALGRLAMLADAAGTVTALRDHDLIATLLLLVFGMALGIALVCLLLVVYFLRTGRLARPARPGRADAFSRAHKLHAAFQGTPQRWLAIRTGNIHWVQMAVRLHNPVPCSWEEGLSAAHEQKLFISPPVGGWVLVFGSHLPDPADDIDRCYHFLAQLSRKLGHVQFFSFNRVVNHHAWVQLDQGQVIRAYAWAGRTLWSQGRMTRAEVDLKLKCYDYAEAAERADFVSPSSVSTNTDKVPALAARWSLDPMAINLRLLRQRHGIAGEPLRSKTH